MKKLITVVAVLLAVVAFAQVRLEFRKDGFHAGEYHILQCDNAHGVDCTFDAGTLYVGCLTDVNGACRFSQPVATDSLLHLDGGPWVATLGTDGGPVLK